MNCPLQNEPERLIDFVAGRLPVEQRESVELHAAECQPCQDFIAEQGALWSALDEFTLPPVSSDFDQRLYARIGAQRQGGWWRRTWQRVFESGEPGSWRPAMAVSALAAMALAVLLVQPPSQVSSVKTPSGVTVETVKIAVGETPDVESVESALEDVEMLRLVGPSSSI